MCARTLKDLDWSCAARRVHSSMSTAPSGAPGPPFSTAWYTGDATSTTRSLAGREDRGESAACSPSWPLCWDCPAMASMMASWEYMLMGVLYWAWMMVALPPGPFTSMGLWVDRAESFRTPGLKFGIYSMFPGALVITCWWGMTGMGESSLGSAAAMG